MARVSRAERAAATLPSINEASLEEIPVSADPLQRGRNIDTMGEAELRAYAIQIGVPQRDARELQAERLRTTCRQQLFDLIDDI